MDYLVEIDGGIKLDSKEKKGAHACIREIKIKSETADPYSAERNTSELVHVEITADINAETKEALKQMMAWALKVRGGATDIYRKVSITVSDTTEGTLRKFDIPGMFVASYVEHYLEDKNTNVHPVATLTLVQKQGEFEDVVNETN